MEVVRVAVSNVGRLEDGVWTGDRVVVSGVRTSILKRNNLGT